MERSPTPELVAGTITVVSGQRGRGKTTLVRELIRSAPRLVVMDMLQEYDYPPVYSLEELQSWVKRGVRDAPRFRVAVRCGQSDADEVLRAIWTLAPLMLVLEEADLYSKGAGQPSDGLRYLIEYGRHADITMIAVTRRPAHVARSLTANAHYCGIFATVEPRDKQYWKGYLPGEAFAKLETLQGYQHLWCDLWTGESEVRVALR